MNRASVWGAFVLLSLVWGSSFLFIRLGLRQLSPESLVASRLVIGAIAMWVIAWPRRRRLGLSLGVLPFAFVIASVNTTIPFLLIAWGEQSTTSGMAAVLNSTMPIFAVLIAGALLKDEPVTRRRLLGVALGLAGVLVLASRDLGIGAAGLPQLAGQGEELLGAISYAIGPILIRRWLPSIPSLGLAAATLTIAAVEALIISLVFGPPPLLSLHPVTILSVVWLGVLGSSLGYLLYYFIIQSWGAGRGTLVAYMLPIVGLALGAVVLGEPLEWHIVGGSALVVLGVVLASMVGRGKGTVVAKEQITVEAAQS
ncbi:MAG: DMT family transporter [Chloroflexota bacterium]